MKENLVNKSVNRCIFNLAFKSSNNYSISEENFPKKNNLNQPSIRIH